MKILFTIICTLHGLIHLMGFAKAFKLAELSELKQPISQSTGIAWLVTALLFIVGIILFWCGSKYWWTLVATGIVISQILIIACWSDARFGTIANLLLILPVLVSFLDILPGSYKNQLQQQVEARLQQEVPTKVITEDHIAHLPAPVQKYLRVTGVVGKQSVQNFYMKFSGKMKLKPEQDWTPVTGYQYSFLGDNPARYFYIETSMFGIPIEGLHVLKENRAVMQIKVASLKQVVDAKGPIMDVSETVTFFNDLCLFAPGSLVDPNIKWSDVDANTAKATFTMGSNAISATLTFDDDGLLQDFISKERHRSDDGNAANPLDWSTPIDEWRKQENRLLVKSAQAIWHEPDGLTPYAQFLVEDLQYNLSEFVMPKKRRSEN